MKVASLLEDLNICVELRSYLTTNIWAMNAQKLVEFTKGKLRPAEGRNICNKLWRRGC